MRSPATVTPPGMPLPMPELLQGRSLESLKDFPEPGFDMDEISAVANLEIHFVDSSGVVSWNFLSEKPDHEFADWNFSSTTQEDYDWLCACIAEEGKDVYIADFEELDAHACRILVPGMSEIYPGEGSNFAAIRPNGIPTACRNGR